MVEAKSVLYRLDFCTDLTATQAPVFHLGYMLEAAVADGARFLGLVSRRTLTRVELDHVNLHTWPEIENLDDFMGSLFDKSWAFVTKAVSSDLRLGSDELSGQFTALSALQFIKIDVSDALTLNLQTECEEWQKAFYSELTDLGRLLKPTLTGEVLLFEPQSVPLTVTDERPEVRSKAA